MFAIAKELGRVFVAVGTYAARAEVENDGGGEAKKAEVVQTVIETLRSKEGIHIKPGGLVEENLEFIVPICVDVMVLVYNNTNFFKR